MAVINEGRGCQLSPDVGTQSYRSEEKVDSTSPKSVSGAEKLGLSEGLIVQELGWDDDVDEDFRLDVMDIIDADLIEDAVEAVDVVLLWLRDDEDEVDALVDALRDLDDRGYIWVMTPKVGRPGYLDTQILNEGARTAGLSLTGSVDACPDWHAHKIVRPRSSRR